MASAVAFWWFPEEEQAFLDYLSKQGPLVAAPVSLVRSADDIALSDFRSVIDSGARNLVFGQKKHAHLIKVASGQDKEGPCYSVQLSASPVIRYDRGYAEESGVLHESGLCAYADYVDDTRQIVQKPIEFVKWYKHVFKWVRDHTPYWHQYKSYRVTERVKRQVEQGWELRP